MLGISDWVLLLIWSFYLALVILFIYKTTTKNRYATILSLGLTFGLIGLTFAAFRPFFPKDSLIYNNYWLFSNGMFYLLLYFFVYVHFSLADRTSPSIPLTIVLASLLGLGIGTSVVLLTVTEAPHNFIMLNVPTLARTWKSITPILDEYYKKNGDFKISAFSYSEMRKEFPEICSNILEGSHRIKTIVKNLKEYSRKSEYEKLEMVDINEMVGSCINLLGNNIKKFRWGRVVNC